MFDAINLAKEFLRKKKLLPKIIAAVIGGSHARGEATPDSDIDLLVIYKDKYASEFEKVHSKEMVFKGFLISLIFQSKKDVLSCLKDPDPSMISFLREGIIVYDPEGSLLRWIKRAKSLKIFEDERCKKESKRRLRERVAYNIKKIELAMKKNDTILGTYLLRGLVDEIIEKMRMYDEDWLYTQRKSNIKYLKEKMNKNSKIKELFYKVNSPLTSKKIKTSLKLLKEIAKNQISIRF